MNGFMKSRFSSKEQPVYRVECGCGSPRHDWELWFKSDSEIPGHMMMEVSAEANFEWRSLWERMKDAWDLIFHKGYTRHADFVLNQEQIDAFRACLADAEAHIAEAVANPEPHLTLKDIRKGLDELPVMFRALAKTMALQKASSTHNDEEWKELFARELALLPDSIKQDFGLN